MATITLNRPAQRNRLENADLKALLAHFDTVNHQADVRVLVLTAQTAGQPKPVFCAGYDIGGFDEPGHGATFFEEIPDTLAKLRPVTLCALNGSVYGGATDLVLACDLRIGLAGTELRMPATALGLHYYPSGLQRFVARMGINGAKRAFLTARPFSAQRLLHMDCLEALASGPESFAQALAELVDDVARLAPLAVQATKQSLQDIETGQFDEAVVREREHMTSRSADFAEGRAAFAERRKPVFVGR
jgi:enoyl-CoA hydratase/carnithine racemase